MTLDPRDTSARAREVVLAATDVVLAIDPGYRQSAYVALRAGDRVVVDHAVLDNADLLAMLRRYRGESVVVIEMIESFGMAVGREVFATVHWSGRFTEAVEHRGGRVEQLARRIVKLHLCGQSRAKDPNVRAALLDLYGPGRELAVGTKARPGPLYGIAGDRWAALAVGVTYVDQRRPT